MQAAGNNHHAAQPSASSQAGVLPGGLGRVRDAKAPEPDGTQPDARFAGFDVAQVPRSSLPAGAMGQPPSALQQAGAQSASMPAQQAPQENKSTLASRHPSLADARHSSAGAAAEFIRGSLKRDLAISTLEEDVRLVVGRALGGKLTEAQKHQLGAEIGRLAGGPGTEQAHLDAAARAVLFAMAAGGQQLPAVSTILMGLNDATRPQNAKDSDPVPDGFHGAVVRAMLHLGSSSPRVDLAHLAVWCRNTLKDEIWCEFDAVLKAALEFPVGSGNDSSSSSSSSSSVPLDSHAVRQDSAKVERAAELCARMGALLKGVFSSSSPSVRIYQVVDFLRNFKCDDETRTALFAIVAIELKAVSESNTLRLSFLDLDNHLTPDMRMMGARQPASASGAKPRHG